MPIEIDEMELQAESAPAVPAAPSNRSAGITLPSDSYEFEARLKTTPAADLDRVAADMALAETVNVPSVLVAANRDKYQAIADAKDEALIASKAPGFKEWMMQKPENVSLGRADPQLPELERIFQSAPKPEPQPDAPAPLYAGPMPAEWANAEAEIGQSVPQPQTQTKPAEDPMAPYRRWKEERALRAENKRRADEILARQRVADAQRYGSMDYTSVANINPETGEAWQNPFEKDRWQFYSQVFGSEAMQELTKLRQESGDYAWSDKTGSMLYRALRKGSQGLAKDTAGLNWFLLEALGLPARGLKAIGSLVGAEGLANMEVPFEEGATMMRQLYDQLDQELGSYKEEEVGTLAKFGLGFVQSIPQMLPQIASAVFTASPASLNWRMPGTPMALKSADDVARKQLLDWYNSIPVKEQAKLGALAATAVAGAQIFGSVYGDARLNGADMAQAAGAALGDATVQGIMENISFRKMFDIWRAKGWRNLGKSIVEAGLTEFATEALQQYPDEFFSWIANAGTRGNETAQSLLDRLPEITSEAIQSGLIGAAWAPILGIGGIRGMARKERMLAQDQQLFEAMDNSAKGSKLREKLPGVYADVVSAMAKDAPITDLYVSPEAIRRAALATGQDTLQLAQTMGVSQQEFETADSLGADVMVPLATYQAKVAGTDASLQLRQSLKTTPDGMTLGEAEQERTRGMMTLRDAMDKIRADQALEDELDGVIEPIRNVLTATDSGFTEQQADLQLSLLKAHAVALSDAMTKAGRPITPTEWLRRYAPQVRRVDAEGNVVATTEGQGQKGQQGQKLDQFYGEQGVARLDKKEKTRRMADLDLARQMETAGKAAQEVKLATGWERGADGKWRYEMPDPQFVSGVSKMLKGGRPRLLWKLLKDGKKNPLIRAYPELASYKIQETKMPANNPGVHYGSGLIKVSDNLLSVTDFGEYAKILGLTKNQTLEHILYHELQHAIQSQEGFAKGGSPSQFSDFKEEVRKLREIRSAWEHDAGVDEFIKKSVKEVMDKKKTLDQHWADIDEFKKNSPYAEQISAAEQQIKDFLNWWAEKYGSATTPIEIYRRLMGEVEARNVQARSDMTPEERRASLAASTEDVAREDQILLGARREEPKASEEPPFKGAGPSLDDSVIGSPTLYQVQNLQEWEENTRALMKKQGRSEAQIEDHIGGIKGQLKLIEATSPEDRIGANLAAQVVGAGQAKKKKTNQGIPYSGPVRSNEDDIYRISFDASSMCVKRLGAAATQKEVEKRIGRPLTTAESTALVALMQANGKAAPCLYCYVEGNRKKAVELVGEGIKIIEKGESEIPSHWKKGRRANAIAAMKEYRDAGLTASDIHWEYILDPAEAFTTEAIAAREKYPNIYTFLNLEAASTKQNKIKLYEEYTNQLLDLSDANIKMLNGFAGVRFFSSSDFQVEHIVDIAQSMSDMELKEIKSHAYTKVMLYVDIFGDTHQKINMSCFAKEDKDGNIIADTAQGWNWEEAKKRRKDHPDCGTVLVASSDKIVRWAMHQDWIDYIIPFHYSGNEKKYWGPAGYQDFSRNQVEKFVYPDKTPVGVPKGEYKIINAMPENERSEYALRKCFNRKAYPVKLEAVFTDIAKSSASNTSKKKLAKERWEQMVASKKFSEEAINPGYWAERLEAGWTTEDKPMFPHEVKKVRMYEIADPNDKDISINKGISNERASKIYLEMCLNRKNDKGEPDPIVPVFPAFMFNESVFADLDAEYAKKKEGKTGDKLEEIIQEHRSAQNNLATEIWKGFVEKGEIDYSIVDLEMFKFKKDFARTDTPFLPIDASQMHLDLAKPALEEVASTPTGLKEKYAPNMIVADQLERLIRYGQENGIENIGVEAIKALVEQKHPLSAVTGGPELPTRYGEAEVYTSREEAEGRTLQQTMPEPEPQTPEQAQDAEYFAAIERGDKDAVQAMINAKAEAMGFGDAIPEQTEAYAIRTKPSPKKTIKVYKVFTLAPDGAPTALFVNGTEKLPQGVWLDAQDAYHFQAESGAWYVPSTQNPYTEGGKTGGGVKIPSEEVRQELIVRGFLPKGSKAEKVTALAYRPGWHAGTLPFFPQGGKKVANPDYKGKETPDVAKWADTPYPNVHRYNQVVFECEMAFDEDYNAEAQATKDGDLEHLPVDGSYYFATNPLTRANPNLGAWVISGSLKINRALTKEEADKLLTDKGMPIQQWEGGTYRKSTPEEKEAALDATFAEKYAEVDDKGKHKNPQFKDRETYQKWYEKQAKAYPAKLAKFERGELKAKPTPPKPLSALVSGWGYESGPLDLASLGYEGPKQEAARKTLAPITYDEDGKIIPLSKRFDPDNPSVLYQDNRAQALSLEARINALFQRAWHGSPFKFSKFTLKHIGEGEGGQAHGYGLYFAKDRAVATNYRSMADNGFTYRGRDINELYEYLERNNEYDKLEVLESFMTELDTETMPWEDFDEKAVEWFKKQILPRVKSGGKLYEVEIPENDILLDEQKSFEEQSQTVKDALSVAKDELGIELSGVGRDLYGAISKATGSDKKASEWLNKHGVKGTTYEGNRDGRCFVIWDNKAIEIYNTLYMAKKEAQNTQPRGQFSYTQTQKIITLFNQNADLSTFAHELGHFFFNNMREMVERGEAPEQIAKDYQTLQDYAQSKAVEWFNRNDKKNYGGRELDKLDEAERKEALWRAREEVLAEGWLTYLKEGKAPSDKLKGVFRRFRQWLVSIYKALRHRGFQPINPDVRAVFDRMLASEAECEAAAARHAASDAEAARIDEVGQAMLTAQEQERLKKARINADDDSKEASFQDALKAYWSATKEAEQKHDAIKREVESRPHFAAMLEALANGGINRQSIVDELGEEEAKALAKKRPGLVRKEGGVDINQVGINQGYEDLSWVDEILDGPTVGEAVKEEMEAWKKQREQEIRREMQPEGVEPGDPAYYNDDRLTALLLEATAMQRAAGRKTRTVGNADAVHEWARRILDDMPMRQAINIGNLSRAEARAAGEAATLLAKGDKQGAADAKRRQAISHAMVLEAMQLRKLRTSLERAMVRWNRHKIETQDQWKWQEQLRAMAQRYSIGGRNKFAPDRPQELASFRDFVKAYDDESVNGAPPFPEWLLSEDVPEKLSAGQYRDIAYAMKWLSEGMVPEEAQMVSDALKGMSLLDAVTEGVTSLQNSKNVFTYKDEGTLGSKAQMAWNDLFAGLDNAQYVFMAADGYKEIGKRSNMQGFHSKLFQYIKEALGRTGQRFRDAKPELERLAKIRSAFCDRFEKTYGKRAATINGIPTPDVMQEIGRRHWTAEMIWSMARNRGNEGNLKTLRNGLELEDDQIDALTSILTAEEWQAVADECALISSSYDDADRAFRAVYGMPMPDKVQPDPFTATTADGSTIDLPGWYFPISVDSALSPEIGDKQEVSAMKDSPDFTALGPSIRRGFTHARTGTGKATALRFAVFEQALWDQWRMIEMGPIVRDLDRLMRNKQWRHAFEHAFGPRYYEQMRQWLKYTARPSQEKQDVVNRTFSNFRSASTIFSLGLNVQTFIRQFGGYPQAIPDVGAGWIVRGLGKAFLNPRALWQEVNRLSPMMADRDKSFVRELREYTAKYKESKVTIAGHDFTRQDVQECAMALVTLGDRMTTYPIWWGAYQRALQKHAMTQEKAVAYADGIVSKTQAVASEADINAWQRDNGFKRLLSMFMSESLRKGSRMRYWYRAWRRGQVPFSEYAWHFSNETFGVALLFLLMKAALTSSAPDKDDVAWAVFDEALGPIPMLNQLSSVMQYNTSPSSMSALKGFDLIGRTFQKGRKWAENPRDSDAIEGMFKAAVDMAAFTAGTGNVRRVYETAAEGWKDVSTGKSQNPFRMFLKGFDKDKQ